LLNGTTIFSEVAVALNSLCNVSPGAFVRTFEDAEDGGLIVVEGFGAVAQADFVVEGVLVKPEEFG